MDDKKVLPASRIVSGQRRRRRFAAGGLAAALLLTCWTLRPVAGPGQLLSWISGPAGIDASFPEIYTDWNDVPVSETLNWAPCFPFQGPNFVCTRLSVPMDYSGILDGPKVHIAMVMLIGPGHGRLPRRFSESPLLVNPGGPGGQGTEFVLSAGAALQAVAGGRDVIGFDPRGVGATVPQADCFRPAGTGNSANEPGSTPYTERNRALMHRYTFQVMAHDTGLPNSTSDALAKYATKVKSFAQMCEKRIADGEKIFRFMGTPDVARDMKTIVAAWDDWMSRNSYIAETPAVSSAVDGLTVPIPSTKGKLVYWGFSYGTLLGATFAAMFPDMVGRLVLDGVMDADYYERPVLGKAMRDADKVLASFFGYCHEANTRCALYRKDDSIADIQARFEGVMSRLREEPLIFVPKDSGVPFTITASDIKGVIFQSLYFPVNSFPKLAEVVDSIYRGDDLEPVLLKPDLTPMCLPNFKLRVYPEDSGFSTSCSDRQFEVNETIGGLQQSFDEVAKITSFADIWSALTTGCSYWKVDRERPQGEEWHNRLLHNEKPIDTSHPIMFLGNTHDPVTPLFQALKMSQRFRNAGLVELEAAGHCTMAATSFCAIRKIQDYFVRGIAPPPPKLEASISDEGSLTGEWIKCQPNQYPWKPVGRFRDVEGAVEELSEEQMELADAWNNIASSLKNWVTPRGPLA